MHAAGPHMVGIEGIQIVYIRHNHWQLQSWVATAEHRDKVVECRNHSGIQVEVALLGESRFDMEGGVGDEVEQQKQVIVPRVAERRYCHIQQGLSVHGGIKQDIRDKAD